MRTRVRSERIRRLGEKRPARPAPWRNPAVAVVRESAPVPARRRMEAGGLDDQAVYACRCGLVFEAPVSTSVDCPHCGDAQAW